MSGVLDSLDHRLLSTLADGEWHSGTELADASDISRAALAKRIGKLLAQPLGLDIISRHGKGYCLVGGLDLLETPQGEPQPALRDLPGVHILRSCESTNLELANSTHAGVVLAEHQWQGRGRRGRQWQAPYAQNILLSLRHRYDHWPAHIASLSVFLGLAVVRLLREQNIPASIKWPNDIWLEGRKLGGILIDTRGEAASGCELIVGCGLNVHMRHANHIDQPWTSLAQEGHSVRRADLAAAMVIAIKNALDRFITGTTQDLFSDFSRWDVFADQMVTLSDGTQRFSGIQRGISATGALRLEDASGAIREYLVGDLSLRAQPATSASNP